MTDLLTPEFTPEASPDFLQPEFTKSDESSIAIEDKAPTWAEIKKATAYEVANNSLAITSVNIAATGVGAALTGGTGAAGAAAIAAKTTPIITGGIFFLRNLLKSDKNFWMDLEENRAELLGSDFKRGVGRAITFDSLGKEMMKNTLGETVGNMAGSIARDIVATLAIGGGAAFKPSAAFDAVAQAKFAGVTAVANGISDYNRRVGLGESEEKAVRLGMAQGVASGAAGLLFMSVGPKLYHAHAAKIFDSTLGTGFTSSAVKLGSVFSGWNAVESTTRNLVADSLGVESADLKPVTMQESAALFGLGAALAGVFHLPGAALKSMVNFAGNRADKAAIAQSTADDVVKIVDDAMDFVEPEIIKSSFKAQAVKLNATDIRKLTKKVRAILDTDQFASEAEAMAKILSQLPKEMRNREVAIQVKKIIHKRGAYGN